MRHFLILLFLASSAFAQTPPCHEAKNSPLCEELLAIGKREQAARTADPQDLARVAAIISRYGWPGKTLVGDAASDAAWRVIRHSDIATQKTYLTMMAQAAESGELERAKVAMTLDHILVADGKPQRYGTAFTQVAGQLAPIEDEANLNGRRQAVGLPPLAEHPASAPATAANSAPVSVAVVTATPMPIPQVKPAPKPQSTTIVARIWLGRVKTSRADEYAAYLYENGPVKIRKIAHNLGAEMLRRPDGDTTEFIVISYWPDRESIKAFAGADIEKVHFLPRDREFLIDPDEHVRHYDVTR